MVVPEKCYLCHIIRLSIYTIKDMHRHSPTHRKKAALATALALALGIAPSAAQDVARLAGSDSLTLTGSVSKLTASRLNKGLLNTALDAISGKAAGVNVSSAGTDRLAMLQSVRVRGTTSLTGGNDPLVIIDGVYSDLATLATVYPADIESFTILKNASETAQFGSRGASGVIEVRTRSGHSGKFNISYDGTAGFDVRYKYLDMLDADGYRALASRLGGIYRDLGYDTDFQRQISRTGLVQNHHVAFSGGTETSNYRASLALMDHKTVIKNQGYTNLVAKLDITQLAFDDRLRIEFGMFGSSRKDRGFYDEFSVLYSAAAMNPLLPFDRYEGGWVKNNGASQISPPGALLHERNDTKDQNFITHLQLTLTLSHDLRLRAIGYYSYRNEGNARFAPTWVWAQGYAYRGHTRTEDYMGDLTLDWNHTWGAHRVAASLAGEYQKTVSSGFWTQAKAYTSNSFSYDNLSGGASIPYGHTGSTRTDPRLLSGLVTASYALLDRYSLDASLRADGSSMVGKDHRWGWFPSVSASWDVAGEPFMRAARALSMLKLRTGYGRTGNLGAISSYLTLDSYMPVGVVSVGGTPTVTMGKLRNNNPDLKWETRSTFNVGADIGFFNNRLLLTAEYYYSQTTDMLYRYDVPVPNFAFDKLMANLGKMENSGFELGVGIVPIAKPDMDLNVNVNLSWQKNKLVSLSGYYSDHYITAPDMTAIGGVTGAGQHGGYNNITYQIVGQPLGVFYLPHCTGLTDNGHGFKHYEIADLDGDGTVDLSDGGDRYIAGQATPKLTLGSNVSFRYRDFDITVQMNGAFGHKIFNATALSYMNLSSFPSYNVMAKAADANIVDQNVTDYWLEDGDYLNIDYITVGWNVPLKSHRVVSGLRLSVSCNNVATITGYSGMTPMINSYVTGSTLGIDDKRCYPAYRTFSIGVNLQF